MVVCGIARFVNWCDDIVGICSSGLILRMMAILLILCHIINASTGIGRIILYEMACADEEDALHLPASDQPNQGSRVHS